MACGRLHGGVARCFGGSGWGWRTLWEGEEPPAVGALPGRGPGSSMQGYVSCSAGSTSRLLCLPPLPRIYSEPLPGKGEARCSVSESVSQ